MLEGAVNPRGNPLVCCLKCLMFRHMHICALLSIVMRCGVRSFILDMRFSHFFRNLCKISDNLRLPGASRVTIYALVVR